MAEKYSYWNNNVNSDNSGDNDFFAGYDEARIPVQVPAGTYVAVLTGWTQIRNSNGTPNLKFSYRIERGEFAGQIVTDLKAMTKAAMGWTKRFCDSIGIDPRKDVSNYPEIWVELVTIVQDGANERQYTNVQSVRRIIPPEERSTVQPSNPAPGSSSQTQAEQVPGAF